jgi:hypothetical protein
MLRSLRAASPASSRVTSALVAMNTEMAAWPESRRATSLLPAALVTSQNRDVDDEPIQDMSSCRAALI